jgi:hypothetical protein
MTTAPVAVFRSSGRRGFSGAVQENPARVMARKHRRRVEVRFATEACTVETPEGVVHAQPGDAILTTDAGERWRVSLAHFAEKYRPLPPTPAGRGGTYESLPIEVLALQMYAPFGVVLADGLSRLTGRAGDWLVDYGDGSLGIVAGPVFARSYDIIG